MRHAPTPLAILAALVLTGCASKPQPTLETALSSAPPPAAADGTAAKTDPLAGGVLPGGQADLAASAGDRVYFAVDRFDVAPDALDTLTRQAAWLARYPNVKVIVAGSADERGTREYNVALGGRRAEAARQVLIARGVAGGRIQTVSYGKERPLDPGSTEEAWARNRNAQTLLIDALGSGR
jgi:peptidoglycan-associated lipoprotein